jgi:hypothetical protein
VARLNFAQQLAGHGLNGATLGPIRSEDGLRQLLDDVLAGDVSATTGDAIRSSRPVAMRLGLLLGSPEFQWR